MSLPSTSLAIKPAGSSWPAVDSQTGAQAGSMRSAKRSSTWPSSCGQLMNLTFVLIRVMPDTPSSLVNCSAASGSKSAASDDA